MAEFFPPVDVEVGNELFWYIFKGEPTPRDGFVELDENTPGLGISVDEAALKKFKVTEQDSGSRLYRFVPNHETRESHEINRRRRTQNPPGIEPLIDADEREQSWTALPACPGVAEK